MRVGVLTETVDVPGSYRPVSTLLGVVFLFDERKAMDFQRIILSSAEQDLP